MTYLKITPKNWGDFQHYKERNPPWIKLHYSLLDNPDFICLQLASKALAPCIWLLASRYKDGIIELSLAKLCARLRLTEKDFWAAFKPLISEGFFTCEQGASAVLASCKQIAMPETETYSIDRERPPIVPQTGDLTQRLFDFDDFWESYPRRCGTNSKTKALERFLLIVKNGTDPASIIAGAERYGLHCDAERKTNTEFVQQATTWLNQRGWETDYGKRTNGHADRLRQAAEIIDRRAQESSDEGGGQDHRLIPEFGKN